MAEIIILIVGIIFLCGAGVCVLCRMAKWDFVRGFLQARVIQIAAVLAGLYAILVIVYLFMNLQSITADRWVEISLLVGLVGVTAVYTFCTAMQANTSLTMAREMSEQRRPIVAPKAFPAIDVPLEATAEEITEHRYSDYFQIYNKGNSPAINLEVLLLSNEKSQLGCLKETVFSQGDKPLEFHPSGLVNHLQSTCYLLCRYCSVLSTEERQIWYETWLPFVPNKSQRGDQIIIVPGELYFRE